MRNTRKRLRRKRRNRRKTIVIFQKVGIVAVILAIMAGGVYGFNQIPSVKVSKFLNEAQEYEEVKDYTSALASYEEALKVESGTVKAYRYMANIYLDMENYKAAEEILYRGLTETQDQEIENTYHTVKYNESVNEINADNCSFLTVNRLLEILEEEKDKESVYELLGTCYDRLINMKDEEGINNIMLSEEVGFGYQEYSILIESMLTLYEEDQKEEMRQLILDYVGFRAENLAFLPEDFESYKALVSRTQEVVGGNELTTLIECLEKSTKIQNLFNPILDEFRKGNYEIAREFIVSDEYLAIRDAFIAEEMDYWKGQTYIPFSDMGAYLHYSDKGWQFSYMDEEDEIARYGYIKVWGVKWLDNGHQRTTITYVPVSDSTEYYPMTEYCMMYWWSTPVNMELTVDTYARMNFRFEENIYTEEGKTTKAINDWGGKYEYKDTYE